MEWQTRDSVLISKVNYLPISMSCEENIHLSENLGKNLGKPYLVSIDQ